MVNSAALTGQTARTLFTHGSSAAKSGRKDLRLLFATTSKPRTLTTAQLINQQQALEAKLTAAMAESSWQLAPPLRKKFAARAAAMVNDVLTDCMYPVHTEMIRNPEHTVSWEHFEAAANKARAVISGHQQVALAMQSVFNPTPHVQRLASGKILILRAAPAIETLVLSGGGVKGVTNGPALRALENLGLLTELKQVVGSSAGAMTAILLASGMSAKALQKTLNGQDPMSLLTTPSDFAVKYPDVKLGNLGFDAGTALQILDLDSAKSVALYLEEHWAQMTRLPQWAQLTAEQQLRLEVLRRPDFSAPRTQQMVTFGDLHLLQQLAPDHFKGLVVTGWNQSLQRVEYFSQQTHPDMPLALAGRISMSIPWLFADVKIEADGQKQRWRDGGIGSNMPSEVVFQGLTGKALEEARARTLLMTFAGGGQAYDAMHAPPNQRVKSPNPIVTLLSGNPQFAQHQQADGQKIYDAGLHVMPVSHGSLSTGSFQASAGRIENAKADAMQQALAYIAQNRNNYRHDVVDDVQAAAALFSAQEQKLFLAAHQNDHTSLNASLYEAIVQQQQQAKLFSVALAMEKAGVFAWSCITMQRCQQK